MDQIDAMNIVDRPWEITSSSDNQRGSPQHAVLVVRDNDRNDDYLESVCEFLDIEVQHAAEAAQQRDVPSHMAVRLRQENRSTIVGSDGPR